MQLIPVYCDIIKCYEYLLAYTNLGQQELIIIVCNVK